MKLKVKPTNDITQKQQNEAVIEKFNAQSSKTAKYAKTVVKKRETSEIRGNLQVNNTDTQSVAGHSGAGASNAGGGEMQKKESEGINWQKYIS